MWHNNFSGNLVIQICVSMCKIVYAYICAYICVYMHANNNIVSVCT